MCVLNLINESLVVDLSAPLVVYGDVPSPAFNLSVDTEVAVELRLCVATHHLVGNVVVVGDCSVFLHKYLLSVLWVDAERRHCPDGRHGAAFVVFHAWRGCLVGYHVLVFRVVPCAERVGDFLQCVLVVGNASEHVDVVATCIKHLVVEICLETLVFCFSEVIHIGGETCGIGHCDIGHHSLGVGNVVVEATGEAVVEEAEVNAEVGVVLFLPAQVFVGKTFHVTSDVSVVG